MHGRSVPDLPTFTFSSGYTVALRRLSPRTVISITAAVRKDHPEPAPPVAMVDYGDGPVAEPNPADPAYEAQLAAYADTVKVEVAKRLFQIFKTYALVYEIDQVAVNAYRAAMDLAGTPIEAEEDDRDVYLWHICAVDEVDYKRLVETLLGLSVPTEVGVQAHIDSFRPDVAGAPAAAGVPPAIRDELQSGV